jgi:hypothetical protein
MSGKDTFFPKSQQLPFTFPIRFIYTGRWPPVSGRNPHDMEDWSGLHQVFPMNIPAFIDCNSPLSALLAWR